MPSHASAEKRVRVTAKRTAVNKARRSQIRSAIRSVEEALAAGDKKAAAAALKVAEPQIMRGVSKGVVHKNTGSRKVSRLSARLKALKG
jgi:small subunit ribosomal protein S20